MSGAEISRTCVTCGTTEEEARFERCPVCMKDFCPDCAHRAMGRRFCSAPCARNFFYGDSDDNEDVDADNE